LICNLLEFYKGYFHNILVFSPTVSSDEKWDWAKKLPLLTENKKLKEFIQKIKDKRKKEMPRIVEDNPDMQDIVPLKDEQFDPKIPESNFMSEYDSETLRDIMEQQMAMVRYLKKMGQSKHLANRVLIIFDDLVGSSLFTNSRDNPFKMFNTNHRHYSFSAIMVTQAYREIPKTVRTNFSCLVCFEISNDKEIEAIYEENPMGLKRDPWQEVYEHCVADEFSFMFLNHQKPKKLRLMKNFDKYIVCQ